MSDSKKPIGEEMRVSALRWVSGLVEGEEGRGGFVMKGGPVIG